MLTDVKDGNVDEEVSFYLSLSLSPFLNLLKLTHLLRRWNPH